MQIKIRIVCARVPSVTGILQSFMDLFANQLRSFNDEFMNV